MPDRPEKDARWRGQPPRASGAEEFQHDLTCAVRSAGPVLITARSELACQIARRIHQVDRATKPFVIVDCDSAAESMRRAFEWAAPEGMLLLRNIDCLTAAEQPSVRALLEESGARVIATTAVDLFALVERGGFDERLFYRLNQVHLVLPAA